MGAILGIPLYPLLGPNSWPSLPDHIDGHGDRLRRQAGVLVAGLVAELGFDEVFAGARDKARLNDELA